MLTATDLIDYPPASLPERILAEVRAITGGSAALYVMDIAGTRLRRLAGSSEFAESIALSNGLGPELADAAVEEVRAHAAAVLGSSSVVVALRVRGRAMCVLISTKGPEADLQGLAEAAAPALELASAYTDVVERARRHRPTTAAAEIQQELLPARLTNVTGATLAGSVIPAYDVGGDWFDHAENPEGTWLAIADAVGHGTQSVGISTVAISAFRAARRARANIHKCCETIDEAVAELGGQSFITAVIASWDADTHTLSWVNCGHPAPLLIERGGKVIELDGESTHPLGLWLAQRKGFPLQSRRLEVGDRVLLYSDGVIERRTAMGMLGMAGLLKTIDGLEEGSAAETLIAIEHEIRTISNQQLNDDATQLLLQVTS